MSEQSESAIKRIGLGVVLGFIYLLGHYEKSTARSWEEIADDR